MASEPDTQGSVDDVQAEALSAGAARRRLLLRGLSGAAPVILTLASNPVSANQCVLASSFASTTLSSRKPTSAQPCSGSKPSGWRGVTSPFTSCGVAGTVTFYNVFGGANRQWATGTNFTTSTTLMQALNASSGANAQLAQYVVAAYLNMKSNKVATTVLNQAQIVEIWTDITVNGVYVPGNSTTVKFTAPQCVTWLSAMMT